MPELPEVQTVVDTLRPRITGWRITEVRLSRTDVVTPGGCDLPGHLRNRTVRSIDRRGKRVVFTLDDGNRFYVHLGMTGRLTLEPAEAEVAPHTHLLLDMGPPPGLAIRRLQQVRFRDPRRFGGVWWLGGADAGENMGPEPLTLRSSELLRRLAGTTRAVKTALLDQRLLAGLGNIYVDESLFVAGIHPQARCDRLAVEQVRALCRAMKQVLRRAIRHRGSTLRDYVDAEGKAGGFQRLHRVYDRAGQPCRNCRTRIERIVLGGRSTHFCPRCQPPSPASRG